MELECPYCGIEALEPLDGPTEVYFDSLLGMDKLNMAKWRAYRCGTCQRVIILDEESVPG